jgi:NAD+ synthase (glutamine-hydrolysing)
MGVKMKVYNINYDEKLNSDLLNELHRYRSIRRFDEIDYIENKSKALNNYMAGFNLSSCIVAISGGVDSAVVLSLVHYASRKQGSPIKRIVALSLPMKGNDCVTGQSDAVRLATELCEEMGIELKIVDVDLPHKMIDDSISKSLGIKGGKWAQAQLVSYVRTPILYYCATLLAQESEGAIIVGTTNKDEGLYLGYFGKASDGMVDLQLISDLHKSEVMRLALFFGVPNEIINRFPTGDLHDGRVDEEIFGAPYDFVEFYLYYIGLKKEERELILRRFSDEARIQFLLLMENLENLHHYNRHKYIGGSSAVHLDLESCFVENGWKTNANFHKLNDFVLMGARSVDKRVNNNFVGEFALDRIPDFFINSFKSFKDGELSGVLDSSMGPHNHSEYEKNKIYDKNSIKPGIKLEKIILNESSENNYVLKLSNVLSKEECEWLLNQTCGKVWVSADLYGEKMGNIGTMGKFVGAINPFFGLISGFEGDPKTGSYRLSVYDHGLALILYERLAPFLDKKKLFKDPLAKISNGFPCWNMVGINPLFRYIRYDPGCSLVCHYDDTYEDNGFKKTLYSVVLYLEDSDGETRFIKDPLLFEKEDKKEYRDWDRNAYENEVICSFKAKAGDLLVFEHRILHDATTPKGRKTIIRTDLFFERIGEL